jgi:hypothetical protein
MGRYQLEAQKIARSIAGLMLEVAAENKSAITTAEGMVGKLTEFADDMNAAFKSSNPPVDANVEATQWKKAGNEMRATVSVTFEDKVEKLEVALPFGGEVTVNGKKREMAEAPMAGICNAVLKILADHVQASRVIP